MQNEIDTSTTAGKVAVMIAFADGKKLEHRLQTIGAPWQSNDNPAWDWTMYNYRIAHEPKTRPLRASDWDGLPVLWMRSVKDPMSHWLVTGVTENRFLYASLPHSWGVSETEDLQWSTDRKTWKPFTVEDTQ